MAFYGPSNLSASPVSTTQIFLSWLNLSFYDLVQVWRKTGVAGEYSEIASIPGSSESYLSEGLAVNTLYYYKVRGELIEPPGETDFSNEASATTYEELTAPSNLVATPVSDTKIDVVFKDNSAEDEFRLERKPDGGAYAEIATLAKNVDYFRDYGQETKSEQKSPTAGVNVAGAGVDWASPANVYTSNDLRATASLGAGGYSDYLRATGFGFAIPAGATVKGIEVRVERSRTGAGTIVDYSVKIVKAGVEAGTEKGTLNAWPATDAYYVFGGGSDLWGLSWTPAEINAADFGASISAQEYSEIDAAIARIDHVQITVYYFTTGLTKGQKYWYRARAKKDANYSPYSNEDDATTYSEPAAPSGLAVSEKSDDRMRLSWVSGTGTITWTKIEKSPDNITFTEVARIKQGITNFLVKGLSASIQYWFKVRHHGPGGNSAYSATATDTTLAQYQMTEFEKWLRNPTIEPVYLVEINPRMTLAGFSLSAGKTYTYELAVPDRAIDIEKVYEDGAEYAEKGSIAEVEAAASSFFFDYNNRKLYIHTSTGAAPSNFLMESSFWLYFSSFQDGTIILGGNYYLPFLSKDDVPGISQEIKPYFEGTYAVGSGSIGLKNVKVAGEYFFDRLYERYTWRGQKLRILMGRKDFAYADFKPILTARVRGVECEDRVFNLDFSDLREEMDEKVVLPKYSLADYPVMDEDFVDEPIPDFYGTKTGVVPVCIDSGNKKYKYMKSRSKRVVGVEKNGVALVENTDYYVDLQRSIITFASAFTIAEGDLIEVSLWGRVNSADELVDNGADVFISLMQDYRNLADSELDFDSIYEAKYANEEPFSVHLIEEVNYEEIVRMVEHTMKAYTFQTGDGKLGLRPRQASASSDARYVGDHQVSNFSCRKDRDSLYWKVNVHYNYSVQDNKWETKTAQQDGIKTRFKMEKALDIYIYSDAPSYAQSLATDILALLNKNYVGFESAAVLFGKAPGDIIKLSRDRFYDSAGTASEKSLRLIKVNYNPPTGRLSVVAEIV